MTRRFRTVTNLASLGTWQQFFVPVVDRWPFPPDHPLSWGPHVKISSITINDQPKRGGS